MDIFFVLDTHNLAVVLDPYQQPASVGVGKRRHAPGNLARVGEEKLEILVEVLALRYHLFQRMHSAKVLNKLQIVIFGTVLHLSDKG